MTGKEYSTTTDVKSDNNSKHKKTTAGQFFKNLFTKHIGIKILAIVLAFVLVIILNI